MSNEARTFTIRKNTEEIKISLRELKKAQERSTHFLKWFGCFVYSASAICCGLAILLIYTIIILLKTISL